MPNTLLRSVVVACLSLFLCAGAEAAGPLGLGLGGGAGLGGAAADVAAVDRIEFAIERHGGSRRDRRRDDRDACV